MTQLYVKTERTFSRGPDQRTTQRLAGDFETMAAVLELKDPVRAEAEIELRRVGRWTSPAGLLLLRIRPSEVGL